MTTEQRIGESLSSLCSCVLRIAIGVAATLGQFHTHGLLHKDIKPARILANTATCHVGAAWPYAEAVVHTPELTR